MACHLKHPILSLGGSDNPHSVMGISGHLGLTFGFMVRHLISIRVHLQTMNCFSKEEWFIENYMVLQECLGDYTFVLLSGISTGSIQHLVVSWTLRATLSILCYRNQVAELLVCKPEPAGESCLFLQSTQSLRDYYVRR